MKKVEKMDVYELKEEILMHFFQLMKEIKEVQMHTEIQLAHLNRRFLDMKKQKSCSHQINNNLSCKQ